MKIVTLSQQSCENSSAKEGTTESGELSAKEETTAQEDLTVGCKASVIGYVDAVAAQGCVATQGDATAPAAKSDIVTPTIGDCHVQFMRLALEQAREAYARNEVPIGAVVLCGGQVIAAAHNEREGTCDPTAHAEVLALRRAGEAKRSWNLNDCDLYVTIEPCAMCSGAIINSRIRTVYYGATDPRFGCGGSLMNLITDPRFNHRAEVVSGICESEARELMQNFFRERRLP